MYVTYHFITWFLSHVIRNSWFRNVTPCGQFWRMQAATLSFVHWNLVVVRLGRVEPTAAPQVQSYNRPKFKVSYLNSHHLTARGMDWGWGSLALVSSKCWTKTTCHFLWCVSPLITYNAAKGSLRNCSQLFEIHECHYAQRKHTRLIQSTQNNKKGTWLISGYRLGDRFSRVRFPMGAGNILFTTASRMAPGPTQPPG
jgi:hypothetical protein